VVEACSGGGAASTDDGGADGPVHHHPEAGGDDSGTSGDAGGDGATSSYDGTSGKRCQSNADCKGPSGPGVNVCSTSLNIPAFPTPVCVSPVVCNPGTDGQVHYCDGPDDPSSPGVCYAVDRPPEANRGVCFPQCLIPTDGSSVPASACQGKNTCNYYGTRVDPASHGTVAVGFCYGGCTADADCPANTKCQMNTEECRTTVTPPTKAVGAACTTTDAASDVCACDYGPSGNGYCIQACIVGSTTAGCPAGYVCDTGVPASVSGAQADPGLGGNCLATCSVDGGACPGGAVCTMGAAGIDCVPQ
jgi:hypothetical protein